MIKNFILKYLRYFELEKPDYLNILSWIVGIELLMITSLIVLYERSEALINVVALPYLLLFVVFQLLLFRYPRALTLNFFFLFLSNAFVIFKQTETMGFSVSLILLGVSFIGLVLHSGNIIKKREFPLLIFFMVAIISTYLNPYDNGKESMRIFAGMIISVILAIRYVDTKSEIVIFVIFFLINQLVSNFYLLYSYFSEGITVEALEVGVTEVSGYRAGGLFENSNNTSVYNIVLLCFLMWHAKYFKDKRLFVYTLVALIIASQLFTGSRTGFILSSLLMLYFFIRSRNYWMKFIGVIFLGFALLNFSSPDLLIFKRLANIGIDESSEERYEAAMDAITCFIDNPLVGVGLNNFSQWRSAVMGTSINSHNTYLSLLAEFGFIGTLAFSIFAWRPFRYFRASRRMRTNWNIMSQYIFIGLLFFFISAFVSQFQGNRNFYLFIAIAGNALALNFSRYTERPEKVQTVQA